jgi:molybdenum cofactor cytidylyltransferase
VNSPDRNNVFALVLAAGGASRFGSTKQIEPVDGVPLARRAMDAAIKVCGDRTALVVGHEWNTVKDACDPQTSFIICNDRYNDGIGTSIALGACALRHVADAIVVLLADQPLITPGHIQALIDTWSGIDDEIVATSFADSLGPPVLFPRACFEDIAALQGDTGGKHLLHDARFKVSTVRFEAAAVDIDTPDDLKNLQERL